MRHALRRPTARTWLKALRWRYDFVDCGALVHSHLHSARYAGFPSLRVVVLRFGHGVVVFGFWLCNLWPEATDVMKAAVEVEFRVFRLRVALEVFDALALGNPRVAPLFEDAAIC